MPRGFLDFVGEMASAFGAAPGSAHVRIWNELKPWLANLSTHAAAKWLPRLGSGIECELPGVRCAGTAIAACDVCKRACCLNHARIDQYGDAICYACVAGAIRQAGGDPNGAGGPPPAHKRGPTHEQIKDAHKVLRVKLGSDQGVIDESYKALLRKFHPDRQSTPEKKAAAEEKFKAVRAAYDLLKSTRGAS